MFPAAVKAFPEIVISPGRMEVIEQGHGNLPLSIVPGAAGVVQTWGTWSRPGLLLWLLRRKRGQDEQSAAIFQSLRLGNAELPRIREDNIVGKSLCRRATKDKWPSLLLLAETGSLTLHVV